VKLGVFDAAEATAGALPEPSRVLEIDPRSESFDRLTDWLDGQRADAFDWWIGSVERRVASRLVDWLRDRAAGRIRMLVAGDLPLAVEVPRPDMVGIDRLLGAVAANRLRLPGRPAVVVDLGTAITVDLVSHTGAFLGGAILPGIGTSARAMHEFTDLLPWLDMQSLAEPPRAVGTSTVEAMTAGIYWGAVGGVRELIWRFTALPELAGEPPEVFLTGGAAPSVARLLADDAHFEPHLVLAGIALAACQPDRVEA
jgi:type III pantothenate kinase